MIADKLAKPLSSITFEKFTKFLKLIIITTVLVNSLKIVCQKCQVRVLVYYTYISTHQTHHP